MVFCAIIKVMRIDIEAAYQEAIERWDEEPKNPASIIYFLSMIAADFKINEKYYDAYIENPEGDDAFIYLLHKGYLGIVDKLIELPETNKNYLPQLHNINKLMLALFKLNDKCRLNLKDFESRLLAKKCLNMMYKESAALLTLEINNCGFTDKLKSLEGDFLTQYIKFILDFEENSSNINFMPTFKEILKEIL